VPSLFIEYVDELEGFKGWLVMDRLVHRLSAGGMRVQPGLTGEHLTEMARNMTRKMRIADLPVDGAKCGIDYDPYSPGKAAAISRFLNAIKPYITSRYSMGPDLNIDMIELESAARSISIPSVKMAIAQAQGWDLSYFMERTKVLTQKINGFSLGQLRAGYGVAAAALGTLANLGINAEDARISLQGFGTLGRATLFGLAEAGCKIVAISDAKQTILAQTSDGLPSKTLLSLPGPLLPDASLLPNTVAASKDEIFNCPADLFIPAALENTVTLKISASLPVRAVVPGANLAVPVESSNILRQRNILVLPDFLAGCGGSLSMEGLYGPLQHPSPRAVLNHVHFKMRQLVDLVINSSNSSGTTPTDAAQLISESRSDHPDRRPYEI